MPHFRWLSDQCLSVPRELGPINWADNNVGQEIIRKVYISSQMDIQRFIQQSNTRGLFNCVPRQSIVLWLKLWCLRVELIILPATDVRG